MSNQGEKWDDRTQWSILHSPIRLALGSGLRGVEGALDRLFLETIGNNKIMSEYLRDNPPTDTDQPLILIKLPWKQAATIIFHAELGELGVSVDEDGVLFVSAYELHAAGLIDDKLAPMVELSREQRIELFGGANPTALNYMINGLIMYSRILWEEIVRTDTREQLRWRFARWRREVIDQLADFGFEIPSPRFGFVSDGTDDAARNVDPKTLPEGMYEHLFAGAKEK
jgi:hypothetical protein